MGYATITNNLDDGRYRIKVDTGEVRRVALLQAVNQALAICGEKLITAHEQVVLANIQEATARESITALIDSIVAIDEVADPAAAGLAKRVLAIEQQKYAKLVASNQPVRQQYATLKNTQADLIRQRAAWESLQTITYKEVWCADYKTDAPIGGYAATIDIPGDSSLTLLAPRCRTPRNGDGTISSDRKAAALRSRANDLIKAGTRLAAIEADLAAETAAELVLRAQVTAAQAAYVATPTDENYAAFEAKTKELATKRHEIANLTLSKQTVQVTINRLNQEIAYWSARPASETPDAGDGALFERELLSPAQVYFNAAIFPGWQKWKPTYRWATITSIDFDGNKIGATIGDVTSSAQRLNVNQTTSISSADVEYADADSECNCRAFGTGDQVVVEFTGQDWNAPKVIGYLDNPRPCPPKLTGTIGTKVLSVIATTATLAENFIGGANPRTFTIAEGVLPPGVSLGAATGILSYAGGRVSEEITESVKVRCHDTFYAPNENRRYDESNTFAVTVQSAWTDVSGSAFGAGSRFGIVGVSRMQFIFVDVLGVPEGRAYFSGGGTFGGTPLNYLVFKQTTATNFPWYVRRTLLNGNLWSTIGPMPVQDGVWYSQADMGVAVSFLDDCVMSSASGTEHGVIRTDFSVSPDESGILCSITAELTATTT